MARARTEIILVSLMGHNAGHLWFCDRVPLTTTCAWYDITWGHPADPNSSVALPHTLHALNENLDAYSVTASTHVIQRVRILTTEWSTLPMPAGYSAEWFGTRINPISNYSETRVLFAAWGSGPGDNIVETRTTGSVWGTPYSVVPQGSAINNIAYGRNNVLRVKDKSTAYEGLVAVSNDYRTVFDCHTVSGIPPGGTETCSPIYGLSTFHARPEDLFTASTGGRDYFGSGVAIALNGAAYGQLFAHGSMYALTAPVTYIYHLDLRVPPVWDNLLAPRTIDVLSTWRGDAEMEADEWWGEITVANAQGKIWRSFNDGSTFDSGAYPWTNGDTSFDSNVVYDRSSNFESHLYSLYNSNVDHHQYIYESINRGPWTGTPAGGLDSSENPCDRPWLAAAGVDRLFMQCMGGLSYCAGGLPCTSKAAWCPTAPSVGTYPTAFRLPSTCAYPSGGCFIEQAGDGTVWLAIGGDAGCDPKPSPYTHSVGLRYITNLGSLAGRPTCAPPTLSTPECVYFVGAPIRSDQLHQACVAG